MKKKRFYAIYYIDKVRFCRDYQVRMINRCVRLELCLELSSLSESDKLIHLIKNCRFYYIYTFSIVFHQNGYTNTIRQEEWWVHRDKIFENFCFHIRLDYKSGWYACLENQHLKSWLFEHFLLRSGGNTQQLQAQSTGAVEYTDCISAEG